jgi:8-oxo-dGTP diphosphatase
MGYTDMPYTFDYPHPAVTVDIVLFTVRERRLEVLLVRRGVEPFLGLHALPGGFVGIAEDLDEAAARELAEETGIGPVYLEQLYTWGRPGRDPRERVISVSFFALIAAARLTAPQAGSDAAAALWWPLATLPVLAFDHAEICALAHARLAAKLDYSTIALQLLPAAFTLTDLQDVYETILGRPLDKRNFRKRILALDIVEPVAEGYRAGRHRPAGLYRARGAEGLAYFR